MKVLITGGAGFIGSHLVDKLIARSDKVLVIDNYLTGRRDNLTPHKNLQVVEGSIVDKNLVFRLCRKFRPDFVVHAAASYKDPENWEEDINTNVLGTVNVVKSVVQNDVKRLIYFQTSLCYGLKPIEQPITLSHPLFSGGYLGGSSYAISKTAAELYIELSGIDFISFRLANIFGPRNLAGPLPTFYYRLANNLPCFVMDTRRDFLYVDNVIVVVMKALDGMGKRGFYHISSGKDISVKQLFDATVKALGIKSERKVEINSRNKDDAYTILIDPRKTNKDFKWIAKSSLENGVKSAVEWYKTHGITHTFTHLKIGK